MLDADPKNFFFFEDGFRVHLVRERYFVAELIDLVKFATGQYQQA